MHVSQNCFSMRYVQDALTRTFRCLLLFKTMLITFLIRLFKHPYITRVPTHIATVSSKPLVHAVCELVLKETTIRTLIYWV